MSTTLRRSARTASTMQDLTNKSSSTAEGTKLPRPGARGVAAPKASARSRLGALARSADSRTARTRGATAAASAASSSAASFAADAEGDLSLEAGSLHGEELLTDIVSAHLLEDIDEEFGPGHETALTKRKVPKAAAWDIKVRAFCCLLNSPPSPVAAAALAPLCVERFPDLTHCNVWHHAEERGILQGEAWACVEGSGGLRQSSR